MQPLKSTFDEGSGSPSVCHVETDAMAGEAESALSALVLNSSDIVVVKDLDRRIVATNMAYARAVGRKSIEEMIGKTEADVLSLPESSPQMRRNARDDCDVMQFPPGELMVREEALTFADGKQHTMLTRKFPIYAKDGRVTSMGMISTDITQRKKAENALRESEEKLGILFASMTEMVVLHELVFNAEQQPVNYRILDCNSAFTEITGISRRDAVGRLADVVYKTESAPFLKQYARVVLTGEPCHFDCWFAPMEKHFSVSAVSLGKNRFSTISTDITAMKHVQDMISSKNRDLERIVQIASHDLRKPLVRVGGYEQELERSLDAIRDAIEKQGVSVTEMEQVLRLKLSGVASTLKEIRSSTRQMERLLDGLLEISQLAHIDLDIRRVDMNDLVAGLFNELQSAVEEVGSDFRFDDLPPCRGDGALLRRVFMNLIDNALKYRDPERSGVITVSGMVDRGKCVYCVEDNGVGINEVDQGAIFDLFWRPVTPAGEGEGLGLPVVRQILSRLNGKIRLDSRRGVGSRFYVMLPADAPQST